MAKTAAGKNDSKSSESPSKKTSSLKAPPPLPKVPDMNKPCSPKRRVAKPSDVVTPWKPNPHHMVHVMGCQNGIIVGWFQHKQYAYDYPAYTRDVEQILASNPATMERAHITLFSTKVDPNNPHDAKQFRRHNILGQFVTDATLTVTQTILVKILEDPTLNTAAYRRKWAENVGQIFTALTKVDKIFEFHSDDPPKNGPPLFPGKDVIISRDAITISQFLHANVDLDQVLESDELMGEVFPPNSIEDWSYLRSNASLCIVTKE